MFVLSFIRLFDKLVFWDPKIEIPEPDANVPSVTLFELKILL